MKHINGIKTLVLFAGLALLALTGCTQPGGSGSGGSTAEKKEFTAAISDPQGTLKVTVEGQGLAASFVTNGKTYAANGAIGSDGAFAVDLSSASDAATKYRFSGSYDSAKKSFTKAQFGTEKALKDITFDGKESGAPKTLYTGTVHGYGLQEYKLTIVRKTDTEATILFSRSLGFQSGLRPKDHEDIKSEAIYQEVKGSLSGNKLTAKVRLEGEDFTFETELHGDGYLYNTRLIGERAYTGDRNPTFIYEYEAKGIDYTTSATGKKNANNKNVAARFNGDLSIAIHLSVDAYRKVHQKTLKDKKWEKEPIGEIFVSFLDLTHQSEGTRRYKQHAVLNRKNYKDGFFMMLYNILDHETGVNEDKKTSSGTRDSKPLAAAFIFTTPKDWFDLGTQSLKTKSGTKDLVFKFGRAQSYGKFMDNSAIAEISLASLKRVK